MNIIFFVKIMFKRYILPFLLLILCACAPVRQHLSIDETIFKNHPKILITQVSDFRKPSYHRNGDQGILENIINDCMTSDVQSQTYENEHHPIFDTYYYDAFKNAFLKKGVKIVEIQKKPICIDHLKKTDPNLIHLAPFDFSSLSNADYALIIIPIDYGFFREYYGIIPLSSPQTFAVYEIYFVDLKDNTVKGYHNSTLASKMSTGGWIGHNSQDLIAQLKSFLIQSLKDSKKSLIRE